MQNKGFAKYININGKFEHFENERDIIDLQNKEIERLNNIINELKQKNNLAENILYDYLYNDGKITKEKYEQVKELKEGK